MATGAATSPPPGGLAATTFFSRTYNEAFALLADARAYIHAARATEWKPAAVSLVHSRETMRLAARLTHTMAWLLGQRALHAGEISRDQARDGPYRLGGHRLCLDVGGENSPALPARLRELLRHSRKLYQRVSRLDEMVGRDRG